MALHPRERSLTTKIAATLTVLGVAAALVGIGTFASFTSTTSATQAISSGTVAITLGTDGSADNRLTVGATGLVPGDTVQRRVKLTNSGGNEDLASITLTTTASPSSLLDTDATDGLQMKIERCTTGTWTEAGSNPYTYTCDLVASSGADDGTRTTVLAQRAIIGSSLALSNLTALTAGNTDDMVVTLTLPTTAGNTFQTLSSTITYTWSGTQRAGTDK